MSRITASGWGFIGAWPKPGETADLEAMAEEFTDRFGPLPEAVSNLFTQFKIKLFAERAGLASLTVENGQYALRFPEGEVPQDLPALGPQVRLGRTALWIPIPDAAVGLELLLESSRQASVP